MTSSNLSKISEGFVPYERSYIWRNKFSWYFGLRLKIKVACIVAGSMTSRNAHCDVIAWKLAHCEGNSLPIISNFVFFDVSLKKLLNKQTICGWFQTPGRSYDVPIMNHTYHAFNTQLYCTARTETSISSADTYAYWNIKEVRRRHYI